MKPAGAGIDDVLVEVFRDQRARLLTFFLRVSSGGAEDLLQETFLRAWDHRASLAGGSDLASGDAARRYLWRIARNLAIDEIRLRRRRGDPAPAGEGSVESVAAAPDCAERVELMDCVRVVRETAERLPNARVRRCLLLWLDGLDVAAIAREASMSIDQARGLLQRGKAEVVRRASDRFRVPPGSQPPADKEAR